MTKERRPRGPLTFEETKTDTLLIVDAQKHIKSDLIKGEMGKIQKTVSS